MNIEALAEEIKSLNYVVMRNWETMPPDGDIDFFVSLQDKEKLEEACMRHLGDRKWFDIRTFGENYYTADIEDEMLLNRREHNGWWIPAQFVHFVSLYYHNLVHKGDGRYDQKLKELFWDYSQQKPVQPNDPGVGFHDPHTHRP